MGKVPLADVRREIALEVLAEWVSDLLQSYPSELHLPCGHCVRDWNFSLPLPGESKSQHRRRLKQRGYQVKYRLRRIAAKAAEEAKATQPVQERQ